MPPKGPQRLREGLFIWEPTSDKPRHRIKKQRHHFADKDPSSQSYGFSSSHVWMWELDHKESWVLKNWYFWTVVLDKTLESPLDCKEIQPVHPKRGQSWVFIGRTDGEAEAPILWPPDGARSAPISRLISDYQPLDQHLSTTLSAPVSRLISACQPLIIA